MRRIVVVVFTVVAICMAMALREGVADEAGNGGEGLYRRECVVLSEFPHSEMAYRPEAAALVREGVLERYGREEWDAVVLTHEFHHHVGIYTILGAKMAVRAREELKAPLRAVKVTAETGKREPLACVVDGLQVGLASTYAQGLIEIPETREPRVAAVFQFKERVLRIHLKDEYAQRVKSVIHKAIHDNGELTPAYFDAIESASYGIWADFDRHEVFVVENLAATGGSTPGD